MHGSRGGVYICALWILLLNPSTPIRIDQEWPNSARWESGVKTSKPHWSQGQNFGVGLDLGLDKLASSSSTWPRPGFGLVNLASRNVLSKCRIIHFVVRLCSAKCEVEPFMLSEYKDMVRHCNVGLTKKCVLLALSPCVQRRRN